MVATQQAPATATTAAFDPAALPAGGGQYQARVRALGDANRLAGQFTTAAGAITFLSAPTGVNQAFDPNVPVLRVTWAAAPGAAGYTARVVDLDHNRQMVASQAVPPNAASANFDPTRFTTAGGNYLAEVQATGGGTAIDSPFAAAPAATRIVFNYALQLNGPGALVAIPAGPALNVGTGDFTVEAWIKPAAPGTIISRKGSSGGAGNGGFLLVLRPDHTFKLATDNGSGFYEVDSQPTNIMDGQWHHVAGVRQAGQLTIYLDGQPVPAAVRNNGPTPMNIDNGLRLLLGQTDQSQEPYRQYGGLMNDAKFWAGRALSPAEVMLSMEGLLSPQERGLAGYWSFRNRTAADLTGHRLDGALQGPAAFVAPGSPQGQIQAAIRSSLLADYPLLGNANDISGHGYNATPTAQVTWGAGPFGQAAAFLQPGANIQLPMSFPRYANNYTLSAWGYLQDYAALEGATAQWGNVAGRLAVKHADGQLAFWFYYDNATQANNQALTLYSKGKLALRKWQHVLVTYDHSHRLLDIYIDGVLDSRNDLSAKIVPTDRPHLPSYSSIGGFQGQAYAWGSALNGMAASVLLLNATATPLWARFLATATSARTLN
jgi:hypothetical protein